MMVSKDPRTEDYIESLPEERQEAFRQLRNTVVMNLPDGYEELAEGRMVSYVVPLRIFPDGYHCTPGKPLPFLQIAFQKNYLALYHFGVYADGNLYDWWSREYAKKVTTKLDMGKSCIRFKKWNDLPLPLIAQLCRKMDVQQWIQIYKRAIRKA